MGLSLATFASHRVTGARAQLPSWGCWYADVDVDGEFSLSGVQTLAMADLTLTGKVIAGGPAKGRSSYRIAGGAGWGTKISKAYYADDLGVRASAVLGDAAAAAGETLATIDPSLRVGPSFTRRGGAVASRVLEQLAPGAWYVDELGVTHLGARAASALPAGVTHGPVDRARGTVTLASEKIAGILPGLVVDGLVAVDVLHELGPKGLRSTIWGATSSGTSRALAAFRAILDQLDPNRAFRGVTEYRVATLTGKRMNLQAVLVSSGMPDLLRVPVRSGVPGVDCSGVSLGAKVLVGFVNSDPARPYVAAFEDADGAGFSATSLSLSSGSVTDLTGGLGRVVRYGDPIVFATPGPGVVAAGAVLTNFSKVSA